MSTNPALSQDDLNVVELSESPGRRLRVQRQSRGLEIERVATQLHLRPPVVEALEQDRFDDLPGPVFVAGYLRNYARLLGLDPEPLIAAYRVTSPQVEAPPPRNVAPPRREIGSGHVLMRLISLALAVGVIALLALWWQNRDDLLAGLAGAGDAAGLRVLGLGGAPAEPTQSSLPRAGTLEMPSPSIRPTAPLPAPVRTDEPPRPATLEHHPATAPQAALPPLEPAQLAALPEPPPEAEAEVAPGAAAGPQATQSQAAAPGGSPQVRVRFSGPCWIDVRDASGKGVLSGEMTKGDERTLAGTPPYSFVIGNAGATSISVNDRPIDLAGRSKGNVARFKLDPANP